MATSSIIVVPEIDSDRFQDLPYDVLYNIFLYCTGHKTIAALQGTCRRCYQIGSEEDALWKNQVAAFYPTLLSVDPNYVGYYFKLRNFTTSRKLAALVSLVNIMADCVSAGRPLPVGPDAQTLLLSSEINLSKGLCLGPTAGLLFRQLGGTTNSFVMLDTLNLNGQHLRAEGLEELAAAAQRGKLPHLKTLSLRENKLGGGVVNEQKRAGNALALLLNSCKGSIVSLDLADNNIVGKSGIEKLLLNGSLLSCVTSAKQVLCLPQRISLNRNHLGVQGVSFLLKTISDLILKGENRNNLVNPACQEVLPIALSCQNVGLGFNFESFADNSGKNVREGAPRASMDELVELFEQIHRYDMSVMERGCKIGATRLQAKQSKALAEARKKLDKVNIPSSGVDSSSGDKTLIKQKILASLSAISRTKQIMFESILILSDAVNPNGNGSNNNSSSSTSKGSTATALAASLSNTLPSNLFEAIAKKKPDVAKFLEIGAAAESKSNANGNKPRLSSSDGIAQLSFSWPSFEGAESGSSCVIC